MYKKKMKSGLVCVFDILDYNNIMENECTVDCAIILEGILIDLPQNTISKYLSMYPNIFTMDEMLNFYNDHYRYIMAMDSIIMTFDYENLLESEKSKSIILSILIIIHFQFLSFEHGYPMRSCIDFGPFSCYGNIFAGKTIENCSNKSHKLDFSGIIITENANKYFINSNNEYGDKFIEQYIFKYIVQFYNGLEDKKYPIDLYTTSFDASVTIIFKEKMINTFEKRYNNIINTFKKIINMEIKN